MTDRKTKAEVSLESKVERLEHYTSHLTSFADGAIRIANALTHFVTLDGKEKESAERSLRHAQIMLLIAARNSIIPFKHFDDVARKFSIEIAELPKPTLPEWAEWMSTNFSHIPTSNITVLSMETLLFPMPPNINDVKYGLATVDEYLAAVIEWKELIESKASAPTKPHGKPFDIRIHGAWIFADKLGRIASLCLESRNDAGHFGFLMAMMERNLERWRNAVKAASGKKGRRQSWHGYFIEQAARSGYGESFDSVLDYLDDMTRPCTFDVDHQKRVIRVLHDDDDKAYDVTFAAAKKAYTRARNKNKK
jgi:hypothetical protein